jgi:hypothetical protein
MNPHDYPRDYLHPVVTLGLLVLVFCVFQSELQAQPPPVKISGGNVAMTISSGLPGGELAAVVNTSTTLNYRRENFLTKITVTTFCPGQDFTLKVVATNVTAGTAAPEITLTHGMLAVDFITNIPRKPPSTGSCTLRYTASATFAQGNSAEVGNDVHTVTYTILAQ